MIARARILLPFRCWTRLGDTLSPVESVRENYGIKIYPPSLALLDPRDLEPTSSIPACQALARLRPAENQTPTDRIQLEGNPTFQGNLLQIDFYKAEFDRRAFTVPRPEDAVLLGDPTIQFVFEITNEFLARLRSIARAPQVKSLDIHNSAWTLEYLTDEGGELVPQDGLYRQRMASGVRFSVLGLTAGVWNKVIGLPGDFKPPIWDKLLLDALDLLPDIGPAIIVANAALETFIVSCLDEFATLAGIKPELWTWINNRGDWLKDPSVSEQFDKVLKILTNKSLKEEKELWGALQNLRRLRNSYAHEGKPYLDGKPVTVESATNLIGRANEIMEWVERLLPEPRRRPEYPQKINLRIVINF